MIEPSEQKSSWKHRCRECEWFMRQGCDAICRVQDKMVNPYATACIVFRERKRRADESPCSYSSIGFLRPVRSDIVDADDGRRKPKGYYVHVRIKRYTE